LWALWALWGLCTCVEPTALIVANREAWLIEHQSAHARSMVYTPHLGSFHACFAVALGAGFMGGRVHQKR
jgi:hypothetical protein